MHGLHKSHHIDNSHVHHVHRSVALDVVPSLNLQLLRSAASATTLNEAIVRGAAQTAHELSLWAADPDLPEMEAAPVLTEASKLTATTLTMAEQQVAHRISTCAVASLRASLESLQSFLQESESSDSLDSQLLAKRSEVVVQDSQTMAQIAEEERRSSAKAAMYIRLLLLLLMCGLLGCIVWIVLMGISEMNEYITQKRRERGETLLGVAIDALDALYPYLQDLGVDVKFSGLTIASALLEELSSARSQVGSQQTMFFDAHNSLFEYRAGKQNFAHHGRVVSVTTPRTYGLLCRQNLSYPAHLRNDLSPGELMVVPDLTPNQCGNDAGPHGVFSTVTPPYHAYAPYVETYRRNIARLGNYYHRGFGTSIALTQDYDNLQQLLSPQATQFIFPNPFGHNYGNWIGSLVGWLPVVIFGTLCLFSASLEIITLCQFRGHVVVASALVAGIFAGSVCLAMYIVDESMTGATQIVQMDGARIVGRCLAAAVTSNTLNAYGAVDAFLSNVSQSSLKSRVVFVYNNPEDNVWVRPADMIHVANAIGWEILNKERIVETVEIKGGYCYASFFDISNERFAVYVEPANYYMHVSEAGWMAAASAVIVFVVVYSYLRLSPLNRLAPAAQGSPLLQRYVAPENLRYVFYLVLLVGVVGTMVALNAFGISMMDAATSQQSRETLQLVGSSIRAHSVVNNCLGSCGLPSTVTMQVFNLINGAATLLYTYVAYPVPTGDWVRHYYGAQLSLSKLPAVLDDMLSFSTPLVNRSSGFIEPRYLQHRMLAAVDVNDTSGFVLERMQPSTKSPRYAFVSHSIGVCLALGAVCIGVSVLEWTYTRMRRLHREQRSLRNSYVIMIVVVVLVSSTVIINCVIMHYEMRHAMLEFAMHELSLAVQTGATRLEAISKDGYVLGMTREELISALVLAANNMSNSVQAGVPFLARWRILEEVDRYGTNDIRVMGGGLNDSKVYHLRALSDTAIPVCAPVFSGVLSVTSTTQKLACYLELVTNLEDGPDGARSGRVCALVFREYEEMVHEPFALAWRELMEVTCAAWVMLLFFLLLVLWWAMHTAQKAGFVLFGNDLLPLRKPWPDDYNSQDRIVPYSRRVLWLVVTCVGSLVIVGYYTLTSIVLTDELHFVETGGVPYETQDRLALSMTSEAITNAYNYVLYPHPSVTIDRLTQLGSDVMNGTAQYHFLLSDPRSVYVDALGYMYNNLTEATIVSAYAFAELTVQGYDTSNSYMAAAYTEFINSQASVMALWADVMQAIQVFFSSLDQTPFDPANAPDVLRSMNLLGAYLQKLYILDHISITSFLIMTGRYGANDVWPFETPTSTAKTLTQNARNARTWLTQQIESEMESLAKSVPKLMTHSPAFVVVGATLTKVARTYLAACASCTPTASVWAIQTQRCVEEMFIGNVSARARVTNEQKQLLERMSATEDQLSLGFADDLSARKAIQLRHSIRHGENLARLQPVLEWERSLEAHVVTEKVTVSFACTMPLFVVWMGACALWYITQRKGVMDSVQKKTECEPLCDTETTTSETSGKKWSTLPVPHVLMGGCLVAVVPMCCVFWLIKVMKDNASFNRDGEMAFFLARYQSDLVASITNYYLVSARGYVTGDLYQVEAAAFDLQGCAAGFMLAFQAYYYNRLTPNITKLLGSISADVLGAYEAGTDEYMMASEYSHPVDQIDVGTPLSAYAREVLLTMTESDNYSLLMPVDVTSVGPVSVLSEQLYAQAVAVASGATTTSTHIFDSYISQINAMMGVSTAYLNMWHAVVTGAAKKGADAAAQYWNYDSLVGSTALDPLSTSGAAGSTAAVSAITNFFAPLLALTGTEEAVKSMFVATPFATSALTPVGAYKNAAYASSYLTITVTAATFANVYAYNRGLTNTSIDRNGKEPFAVFVKRLEAASLFLISDAMDTDFCAYTLSPATRNTWIWATELIGEYESGSIYQDAEYIHTSVEWCCVTMSWALLIAFSICAKMLFW